MKRSALMIWFALGHLANDWPIAALWLLIPAIGLAMELTASEVGLLFTLVNIGGSLGYLPAGILADQVSNRGRLLIVTFWWVAVGYGVASLAGGYWELAILLAIAGMGNAAWHPIAAGVLANARSDARARALGIHAVGGALAEMLAPLCAGVLLLYVDWRAALAISALPAVVMGLCFLHAARAVPRAKQIPLSKQDVLDLLRIWRQGNSLRVMLMISLYNMASMALLSMIPFYLSAVHHFSATETGVSFSALLIVGAATQPLIGEMSDRVGRGPVLILGNVLAGVACLALVLTPPIWTMLLAMTVAVAAIDAIRSTVLAAAVEIAGRREGTTIGLAFVFMDGVGALGSVLAGLAAGFLMANHVYPCCLSLARVCGACIHHCFHALGATTTDKVEWA